MPNNNYNMYLYAKIQISVSMINHLLIYICVVSITMPILSICIEHRNYSALTFTLSSVLLSYLKAEENKSDYNTFNYTKSMLQSEKTNECKLLPIHNS